MSDIVSFRHATPAPVQDPVAPERRLLGNPQRTAWPHYAGSTGEFKCGVWESGTGSWRTVFPHTKEEYFYVIEGQVRLTADGGEPYDLGPGDAAVIPAGFIGTFEVVKPVRKHYVILEKKLPGAE